ncbi:MAG: hypothetical protein J3R72DRAFT_223714 [Linnemannia gamsii]|nr:MAG: hypothetical protein J3R72DRAFT_223714 [Linnemannia gamsii]
MDTHNCMPYPSKTPSSERRRSHPSNTTTPSWKLTSLLLFLGLASLTTTAAKAPVQPPQQRVGVVAAATVPRHDPFNGLFNPRPNTPHLFGGVPHGVESAKPKRPAKMVKVPYFIEHLITPQRESVEATSITTTTIAATTRTAGTSATSNAGNTIEHDHSSHKEGHCRVSNRETNRR